jgi:ornithine carbamoyltransferase
MVQVHGPLDGSTVAWVGDYNNVARSLAQACTLLGAHLRVAGPDGYAIDDDEAKAITDLGTGSVERVERPADAVRGAIAVHTDTWTSMGQEEQRQQRLRAFSAFTVDAELMSLAAHDAGFYHCMPAHRGEEVTASVIDGPRSQVVRQAHNRLHAARGALAHVLGVR